MRIYRSWKNGACRWVSRGPEPGRQMTSTMNRFLSAHAMSFVTCNMTHMTNWVVNGLPERFPDLKVIWIESGLAWVPFMMQRLDHEYQLRQSEAPLLKRMPSEYMREMYYTSQPLEMTDMDLLESTFRAIDAEHTLLYSSDWPHWDFDVPGRIMSAVPLRVGQAQHPRRDGQKAVPPVRSSALHIPRKDHHLHASSNGALPDSKRSRALQEIL